MVSTPNALGRRQKILIVDDKRENLLALRTALDELDAEWVEASNGNDALMATLHHHFALAILDILMPGMDGYELAALLRGDPRTCHLPIIFMTAAYGEEHQIFKGYDLGAVDYLVKPYNPRVLLSKVNVFLDLSRAMDQAQEAKREVQRINAELEERVQQRTQELETAQREIQRINAELEARVRRRTRELETANQDLESFSYSVSHDLRAPLRAIDGFIGILREDYGSSLDEEGLRLFGVVSDNARMMGRLIDDILAISRAGRLELEHTLVDMNALVDEVWARLSEQPGVHRVEFFRDDLPAVSGDVRALRQVWQNLLGNALKFSRKRTPAHIEVSAERRDDLVWYAVKDNGAGFDPGSADRLFVLFQRLHGPKEFEGTGVGLAIVKRFIERHGGQLTAEGVIGVGAKFRFGLPIASDATVHKE